jgi:DNA polymerase V
MRFSKAAHSPAPKQLRIPLFSMPVSAGMPSEADDYVEETLDLARLLVKRPESTFFVKVEGESMEDASIFPGDILVVDRSLSAAHGDIVIAIVDGEFTVKTLAKRPRLKLLSRNKVNPTDIDEPFEIWGVVLWVVHKARN